MTWKKLSLEPETKEMSTEGTLVRTGACNHCGLCCKPPVILENPMISLGEDRCKFYVKETNNKIYGHCLIYGRGNKPIKKVTDRFGNTITPEQIKWFEQNCVDYPTAEDAKAGHKPPSGCGFTFEVAINE